MEQVVFPAVGAPDAECDNMVTGLIHVTVLMQGNKLGVEAVLTENSKIRFVEGLEAFIFGGQSKSVGYNW